jgi:hypothetical protein
MYCLRIMGSKKTDRIPTRSAVQPLEMAALRGADVV